MKYLNILSTNYEFSDFFTGDRRRIICTKSYEKISNDLDISQERLENQIMINYCNVFKK